MTHMFRASLAPLTALGLLLASPAVAQTPPQDIHYPSGVPSVATPVPAGQGMMGMVWTHTEGALAFLKAELGITGEQNAAWNAYTAQVMLLINQDKDRMQTMQTMHDPVAKPLTWLEWLAHSEVRMSSHVRAVKNIQPAAAALYAALSPEQKKKADALMPGVMGTHMGMQMGGMPMWRMRESK